MLIKPVSKEMIEKVESELKEYAKALPDNHVMYGYEFENKHGRSLVAITDKGNDVVTIDINSVYFHISKEGAIALYLRLGKLLGINK